VRFALCLLPPAALCLLASFHVTNFLLWCFCAGRPDVAMPFAVDAFESTGLAFFADRCSASRRTAAIAASGFAGSMLSFSVPAADARSISVDGISTSGASASKSTH